MRTSEPKPHQIKNVLVAFDFEVRMRVCRQWLANFEIGPPAVACAVTA